MKRNCAIVVGLSVFALLPAVPAGATEWGDIGSTITTTLSGGRTVPGPGDNDGTGTFRAAIAPSRGQMCYQLEVQNLGPATRAQVHQAGRLRVGEPVLELDPPVDGSSASCVTIGYRMALRMVRRPWDYYVNVATAEHPGGAIRGQMGR